MARVGVTALALSFVVWPMFGCAADAAELDLRPIVTKPEPLGKLHPKLQWMRTDKIRAIWAGDDEPGAPPRQGVHAQFR